jgi:tRNA acetyltransferase TAN1
MVVLIITGMKVFNILATTDHFNISHAASELWMLLRTIGDETPKVNRTGIKGVIKCYTTLDPIKVVHILRATLKEEPNKFSSIFRIMPIERITETKICLIVKTVKSLIERIGENETFRITLEKRKTDLRSLEVIEAVALVIDRSVNLEEPNWIVLIEILGKETGISVVRSNDILNIQKEKSKLFSKRKKSAFLYD